MKRYSIPAMAALLAILVSPACADNHAENNAPQFIRTASGASFDTDFTVAAEKTVNAVVCIKSFTTQRQQNPYGNQGGGYDPFSNLASSSHVSSSATASLCRAVSVRAS